MGVRIYRDVPLGDMLARYYLDEETRNAALQLLPAGRYALASVYGVNGRVTLEGSRLIWDCADPMSACAVYLRPKQ